VFKFGSVIKFVPHPITVGFTSGIAITLLSTQVKDFLGLSIDKVPAEFIEKWEVYFSHFNTINYTALLVGVGALIIMVIWPKINKTIPGSLVALIVTTLIVTIFNLPVETIGSRFGNLSSTLPMPTLPVVDLNTIQNLIQPALTIAILAAIESLLSAVVADGMIGGQHDSNMELIAQGFANIGSALFGGIPATGAIARTAANVKNGGRSPISGIVHAITLLLIMLIFMPLAKLIPMTTLASILIIVSYNMGEWKTFYSLLKAPKSDIVILVLTFVLTVVFDLVVAIEVGMVLAMFLFMKRIADTTKIQTMVMCCTGDNDNVREENSRENILIYEINGPFFFGIVHRFMDVMKEINSSYEVLILDMKTVNAIDSTAIDALETLFERCEKHKIKLLLSNINEQPYKVLKSMGFLDLIGEEALFKDREEAIKSVA